MPPPPDEELIAAAAAVFENLPANFAWRHTVGAAARSRDGRIFSGRNVFHFTGGPCAEMTVLGSAAAGGVAAADLVMMVAVKLKLDEKAGKKWVLVNPCGRCRQTLLDYNPRLNVIVVDKDGQPITVTVRDLLPYAYTNSDSEEYGGDRGGGGSCVREQRVWPS